MKKLGELYQTSDWKTEKHVPVIECPDSVKSEQPFEIKVTIGKEVAHPNTTEHHIRWIQLFFHPEGEKFSYQIANCEFTAHGESVDGADKGPVYTHHSATITAKLKKPGTLYASSLFNIHGFWESQKQVKMA